MLDRRVRAEGRVRRVRAGCVGLAAVLSLGTGPSAAAQAPVGERDLAYEEGVGAEEAGEHARAAAAYERAFRLTLPAETGPRLLFLRASVAARMRADDGTPATRVQLCHAQALLRGFLGETGAPSTEEHANLGRIDQRLALAPGPDCAALLAGPVAPPVATEPEEPEPAPTVTSGSGRPTPVGAAPPRGRTLGERALLGSGIAALGIGAAALAVMGSGISISRAANRRGQALCVEANTGCGAIDLEVIDLVEDGYRGERLTRAGAAVGGLAIVAGVTLVVVGELRYRQRRVAVAPRVAPGQLGLALSGRF